jgi:hypothetical protein
MAFVELFAIMIDFFATILMDILPILGYILWLIIRVLILILVWIIFAIALIIVILQFAFIVTTMYTLSFFLDIQLTTNWNQIVTEGDIDITFKYVISSEFIDYISFHIPIIETRFESDNMTMNFKLGFFSVDLNFEKYPNNPLDGLINSGPRQSSALGLKSSDNGSNAVLNLCEVISNIGDSTGLCGLAYMTTAFISNGIKNPLGSLTAFIIGIGMGITEFILWFLMILSPKDDTERIAAALFGYGFGFIISGVAAAVAWVSLKCLEVVKLKSISGSILILKSLEQFDDVFSLIGLSFGISEVAKKIPKDDVSRHFPESILSITGGVISLTIACNLLMIVDRSISQMIGTAFILIGCALVVAALFILYK